MERDGGDCGAFARRVLIAVGITMTVVALLMLLWYAVDILLLIFAGILLAVLLRAPADWLARHTPLSGGLSLVVVILALGLLLFAGGRLLAPSASAQFEKLAANLPQSAAKLQQQVSDTPWGSRLMNEAASIRWSPRSANILGKITGAVSTFFGALADLAIIGFIGLYLAAQPDPYINGLVRLVPVGGRPRAREVIASIGSSLQWWLIGKLFSMTIIGILTGVGLWWLGIPLALALALVAGLLSFVPYLGPILAAVPAVLLAFTQGTQQALYVALLYLGVQIVESYLLTPLVQQQSISLPAAAILFAQVLLGILVGGMGVVLATPLAAAILVAVKMLYIEDVLGDAGSNG